MSSMAYEHFCNLLSFLCDRASTLLTAQAKQVSIHLLSDGVRASLLAASMFQPYSKRTLSFTNSILPLPRPPNPTFKRCS